MSQPYEAPQAFPNQEFEPYPASKGPEERQGRGCWFYGCITLIVLAILVAVLIGVGGFLAYRGYSKLVMDWTDTTPRPMPEVTMPAEERKALEARVENFQESVKADKPTEPLVLDSDDINALIDDEPQLKGTMHVDIQGDKIKAEVSIPLEKTGLPLTKGRYVNGSGTILVELEDDFLVVRLDDLEVRGKKMPDEMRSQLRAKNLADDFMNNPKNREMVARYKRIEVKDGKLYVYPKTEADHGADAKKASEGEKDKAVEGSEPKEGSEKAKDADDGAPKKVDEGPKPESEKPDDGASEKPATREPAKDAPAEAPGEAPKTEAAPKAA